MSSLKAKKGWGRTCRQHTRVWCCLVKDNDKAPTSTWLQEKAEWVGVPCSVQSWNAIRTMMKTQRKQTGCPAAGLLVPMLLKQWVIANILLAMLVLRTQSLNQRWKNECKCNYITRNGFLLLLANKINENDKYSHHLQNGSWSNRVSHGQ